MQIERSKRANANGGEGSLPMMLEEKSDDLRQCLSGRGRGNAGAVANVVRPRADGTDDLAAACLYCAEEHVRECCLETISGGARIALVLQEVEFL